MGRFLNLKLPHFSRKYSLVILAFSWFLGLFLGVVFSIAAGDSIISLMSTAVSSRVSIVGLLTAILLPFLLSAFAVLICEPCLLVVIAFGKAFVFSYLSLGLMAAYGSAGWLVWLLLMFSDCCFLPLLMLYWIHFIFGGRSQAIPVTAMIGFAAVAIGSFDFYIVSPFLASLIS